MEYDSEAYPTMDAIFWKDSPKIINSITVITKIETSNPNVIETTSAKNKLYHVGDEIIFSFDYSSTETKLCFINLNTFTARFKNYDKPAKSEKGYGASNSYLFDNKLFQIACSKKKVKFTVTDLATETIVKEYAVKKGDTITFKNSLIVQEGATTFYGAPESGSQGIEKTAKFLQKISTGDLGISAYKIGDLYNVLLGTNTKLIYVVGFNMGGVPGGIIPSPEIHKVSSISTPNLNPTSFRYIDARSTYINCLFDANLEHTEGKVSENKFDKIHQLEKKIDKFTAQNIFIHRGKLHFGYFHLKDRMYRLHRFE